MRAYYARLFWRERNLWRGKGARLRGFLQVRMRGAVDAVATPASEPMAPRKYVLLVSGTMNPPHRGHVRLGLHAAEQLQQQGHTVTAIAYCPVHDNYLYNKLALKASESNAVSGATLCFPMARRSEMLRSLLKLEDSPLTKLCQCAHTPASASSGLAVAGLDPSRSFERSCLSLLHFLCTLPALPLSHLRSLSAASSSLNTASARQLSSARATGSGCCPMGTCARCPRRVWSATLQTPRLFLPRTASSPRRERCSPLPHPPAAPACPCSTRVARRCQLFSCVFSIVLVYFLSWLPSAAVARACDSLSSVPPSSSLLRLSLLCRGCSTGTRLVRVDV